MSTTLTKDLKKLFKKGAEDPAFFVKEVIGMTELWEKQVEIARSVKENGITVVRSCNGAGKTFTTANVVTWFLTTHPNSIVVSTAPTARQVRELLWQEINNIHANSKFPLGGRTTTVSWSLGAKWFAVGLSTDDPNRFQGFHAEHILGVIDEGAGVDAPIWEGMDAILTSNGARLLVIGNPTEPSGRFFDAFKSPLSHKIHISAFDTPNFTVNNITLEDIRDGSWKEKNVHTPYPALVTPKWVAERFIEWGEESPAFQSRILGNFPSIGTDTMIPLGWATQAQTLELTPEPTARKFMAVDVARFGDDESTIGIRTGPKLSRLEVYNAMDVYTLSKQAKMIADQEKPEYIEVDVVGIGAGVADNLRAWGYKVIDYIAQARAFEPDKHINRRTESWYNVRERMRRKEIDIPVDDILLGQLTSPKYTFDGAGRYRLESKDDMKKRGLSSPDRADVVIMLFDDDYTYDSAVAGTIPTSEAKPGTVQALLDELIREDQEGNEWGFM